jgi:hypothetical protein
MGMFSRTREAAYLDDAINNFRTAINYQTAPTLQRLRAARHWAHHTDGKHDSVWEAYKFVLDFVPQWDGFMHYLAQSTAVPLNAPVEVEEHSDRLGAGEWHHLVSKLFFS